MKWFDKEISKNDNYRKVLLFMENAVVYKSVLDEMNLKHTKVDFFQKTLQIRRSQWIVELFNLRS